MNTVLTHRLRSASVGSAPRRRGVIVAGATGLAMLLLTLVSAGSVSAQVGYPGYPGYGAGAGSRSGYPPNALISSYFDPRYCGNGAVSVVTDAGGALIDICTSTGQRILPVYPDYSSFGGFGGYPGYGSGFGGYGGGAPTYSYGYGFNNGFNTGFSGYTGFTGFAGGYQPYPVSNTTTNGNTAANGYGSYTDPRTNCPGGQVSSTPSGFFCTATGAFAGGT